MGDRGCHGPRSGPGREERSPPPPPPLRLCTRIVWMLLRIPRQTNATPCLTPVESSQRRGWESMGLHGPSPALLSATPTTRMQHGSSVPSQTSNVTPPPPPPPPPPGSRVTNTNIAPPSPTNPPT